MPQSRIGPFHILQPKFGRWNSIWFGIYSFQSRMRVLWLEYYFICLLFLNIILRYQSVQTQINVGSTQINFWDAWIRRT